jgi:hypothetical protein
VAEIQPRFPEKPDLTVTVDSRVWKEMLSGISNPLVEVVTDMKIEGGTLNLIRFLRMFQG